MTAKKCFDDQWIVITGGAGFIGSSVVRQLNDLGYDKNIIIVDDVCLRDRWENLGGKKFSEIIGPHEFKDWLENNKNDVEAIVHLACTRNPERMFDVNYRLGTELASFAIDYNIRFIYASSAETYGYGRNGYDDNHDKLDALRPEHSLGGLKHLFDLWALRNKCLSKVVGLKFSDVYGPNDYHDCDDSSLVMLAFKQARNENKIEIPSFGRDTYSLASSRDFVFVKDVARVICEFLFNDACGIYNVGSGVSTSLFEMAEFVKSAMNSTAELLNQALENQIEGRKPHALKMDKLEKVMSIPSTKIEDGIKDYVQNYLLHKDLW